MSDRSPDKRREDVLDVRNQMAARAIQWERQPGIHNGVTIAEELRWWIDRFDEAMPASTPSATPCSADTERLDWLDKMNVALNRHYGTSYSWRVILSPHVTRLMMSSPFEQEMALIDLNDTDGGQYKRTSCRAAIDDAMKANNSPDGGKQT